MDEYVRVLVRVDGEEYLVRRLGVGDLVRCVSVVNEDDEPLQLDTSSFATAVMASDGSPLSIDGVLFITNTDIHPATLAKHPVGNKLLREAVKDRHSEWTTTQLDKAMNQPIYHRTKTTLNPTVNDIEWDWKDPAEVTRALQEQAHDHSKREEKRRAELAMQANVEKFINPYTFVPFPTSVDKSPPQGHEKLSPGNLSGRIAIEWRTITPIMLPQGWHRGRLIMPGSSIKGAVRSLHETITGGCLRVFDPDFLPIYRQTMGEGIKESQGWTMAEVRTVQGQPVFYPAKRTVWVEASQVLTNHARPLPETGKRYRIDNYLAELQGHAKRSHLHTSSTVVRDDAGDWYILVSDAHARRNDRHYYFAMGEAQDHPVELAPGVLASLNDRIFGTNDQRLVRKNMQPESRVEFTGKYGHGPQETTVTKKEMGTRHIVGPDMWPSVVWVQVKDRDGLATEDDASQSIITAVSIAAIWRIEGEHPAKDRLAHNDLLECTDPERLCPSCRVFGMADTSGRSDSAEQNSYAAHVRFADAWADSEPTDYRRIRTLMSPRPGFGPFYLEIGDNTAIAKNEERPTGRWGAKPDKGKPRRLRGRKYYWHAKPDPDPPRKDDTELAQWHRWYTTGQQGTQADRVSRADGTPQDDERVLFSGSLHSEVVFDNLTREDLGGLIAALDPSRLFDLPPQFAEGREFATHLGGGKPLGLGSVIPTVTIKAADIWSSGRYVPGLPTPQIDDVVKEFVAATPSLMKQWEALAHVLDIHKIDPNLVWYPPGADRSKFGRELFGRTFKFFTVTDGNSLGHELKPLPDPTADDQTLPILTA